MNSNLLVVAMFSIVLICFNAATHAKSVSDADSTSTTQCDESSGCSKVDTDTNECKEVCGCDGIYKFDNSTGECVINYKYLIQRTRPSNLMHSDQDLIDDDDGWAKKIREDNERVFRGIIFSALFIVICASICVISVCLFCCRIHYSDQKLKNEVKDLARKLQVDYKKKRSIRKKERDQKEESCNVIVEDTHIMCI